MRCLVLGAGGFIGTNLCRALVSNGHTVRAFGRRQPYPDAFRGCDWLTGDFMDPTGLVAAMYGCDVVFHLITSTTPASANIDKIADLNSNVVSTLHLLEACREMGIRRVVFVSSGGTVYGVPDRIPTPEDSPVNPITAYGISKLAIERYLALYEHLYGLEYRVLRVANPFGPYQTAIKNQGVIAAFVEQALLGKNIEMWGDGNVIRDYIFIDDVIDALVLAASHDGVGRIFNIGSGQGRSLNDIKSELDRIFSRTIPVDLFSGRSVDVPVSILDISSAARDLHWIPKTTFENGLKLTVSWLRSDLQRRSHISQGEY